MKILSQKLEPDFNRWLQQQDAETPSGGLLRLARTMRHSLKTFLQTTNIHGVRFLDRDHHATRHWFEWLFWITSCVTAFSIAIFISLQLMAKWSRNPIFVSFDKTPTPIWDVPFPAVTVCNVNPINKVKADLVVRQMAAMSPNHRVNLKLMYRAAYLQNKCPDIQMNLNVSELNDVIKDVKDVDLSDFSQPCSQLVSDCKLNSVDFDCSRLFLSFVTDLGLCCSFNLMPEIRKWDKSYVSSNQWTPTDGYRNEPRILEDSFEELETPYRTSIAGVSGGLSFTLNLQDDLYSCSSEKIKGFKILAHSPISAPVVGEVGAVLEPGKVHFIDTRPKVIESEDNILNIDPSLRMCYLAAERELTNYKYYSLDNCAAECRANVTLVHCGCVPSYMPRQEGIDICGPTLNDCMDGPLHEHAADIYQELKVGDQFSESRDKFAHCGCKPSCTELGYEFSMSSVPLETSLFKSRWNHSYVKANVAVAHIFVGSQVFIKKKRGKLYDTLDFFASIGGILGLCTGVSVISLVEVVYYTLVYTGFKWRCAGPQLH